MSNIPYANHSINGGDIEFVVNALNSGWLTQGKEVEKFENRLCKYTGAKYALAVSSGTAALHLSMLSLGIGKGDVSVTTPITFSASSNCILYVGAKPKFIDIDDRTYHLDVEKLRAFLGIPANRRKIKAVIPVHHMGTVADITGIRATCNKYSIRVIEDAAHALGAKYKRSGRWIKIGSCKHSDITIFSFHPIKHITTGEGGAILTNDSKVYNRALRLRHHGIERHNSRQGWFYDINEIGYNYRLTDFQCALGSSQLKRLRSFVSARRKLVHNYNKYFQDIEEIRPPYEAEDTYASYHLYVIRVPRNKRDALYRYLKKNGISSQVNYIPVHTLSYYKKKLGYKLGNFPIAERYYNECLSLPLYAELSEKEQEKVVKTVKDFFVR